MRGRCGLDNFCSDVGLESWYEHPDRSPDVSQHRLAQHARGHGRNPGVQRTGVSEHASPGEPDALPFLRASSRARFFPGVEVAVGGGDVNDQVIPKHNYNYFQVVPDYWCDLMGIPRDTHITTMINIAWDDLQIVPRDHDVEEFLAEECDDCLGTGWAGTGPPSYANDFRKCLKCNGTGIVEVPS